MDKIKIICLGGQDETFKALTIVEVNNDIFVIECGTRVPDKTQPGVDFIAARIDYLIENKNKIRGYFITHGHDSIFTGLLYLYDKIPAPIYCTKTTHIFIKGFADENRINISKYNFVIVNPSDDIQILNRTIKLFATCSNIAESFGLSISTDQGNIVYLGSGIMTNDVKKGFTVDRDKITSICSERTLVLLADSLCADRPGYCSPNHSLYPIISRDVKTIQGRLFVAIDAPDLYNIVEIINSSLKAGRKIIPYDNLTLTLLLKIIEIGCSNLRKEDIESIEEINRIAPTEATILITDFGNKLNNKISLLAEKRNDNKMIFLNQNDTFIYACHKLYSTELTAIQALDNLYRTDAKIIAVSSKEFFRMHGFSEDLKNVLLTFRPKYFIPITAQFKQLLAAAKLAVGLNCGLNHNTVFIIENGDAVTLEAGFAKFVQHAAIAGDLFIDGKAVGDLGGKIFEERQKFSDDGVIILAATISKSERRIVAGPDVQARGFVFIKDSESLMREISRLFEHTINNELAKENYSIAYIENGVKDIVSKAVTRNLNKNPIIVPYIAEIK